MEKPFGPAFDTEYEGIFVRAGRWTVNKALARLKMMITVALCIIPWYPLYVHHRATLLKLDHFRMECEDSRKRIEELSFDASVSRYANEGLVRYIRELEAKIHGNHSLRSER